MSMTILGVMAILLFAIHGYCRGLYKIAATLVSFFIAALLAKRVSLWLEGPLGRSDVIPESLTPLAALVLAGVLLFLFFAFCAGLILRKRETIREQEGKNRIAQWERIGGAALGTAWGLFLVLFIMIGIRLIGNVEEVFEPPSQHAESHEERTESPPSAPQATVSASMEFAEPDSLLDAREPGKGAFIRFKNEIENSVFGSVVLKTDPIGDKAKDTFRKLRLVMSNPDLYEEFAYHPVILRYVNDPRIQALTGDKEIQNQMQTGQYYALLDNPKIAALLQKDTLVSEMKKLNLGGILEEVITAHFNAASKKTKAMRCIRCPHCMGDRGEYKEMFRTEEEAQRVRMMLMGTSRSLHAYACPFGNGWHVSKRAH
jgi:hypothetical protein